MRTLFKMVVLDALTRMTDARKFIESEHKRDERGRFTSGGGKGSKSSQSGMKAQKTGRKENAAKVAFAKITGKPLGKMMSVRMAKTDLDATNELAYHTKLDVEIGKRLGDTTLAQARKIPDVEYFVEHMAAHADLRKIVKTWGGDAGKRGDGVSGNELAARAKKLLAGKSEKSAPKAPAKKKAR